MGIAGLLPLLKKASSACHVRKFSGATVAIDGYCWLHKGAFGCAAQLGKGEPTTAYISYCVKYINVLLAHNIKPVMVLDGRNLPSKGITEKKRREKREENRKMAKEYLRKGMNKEAWECFTRCVDITPAMAREFIKVLRRMNIDYVVAPYEADAQLAYLAINNLVDIVITEDSDLVLFGCPKIFFKMNATGDGVLFDKTKIPKALGLKPKKEFKFEKFRWMCILSGCDYLPSIPGIGLGRAKKLILDIAEGDDIVQILKSLPEALQLDVEVTDEYIQGFLQAELTFLHQLVFDTLKKRLVPLNPYSEDLSAEKLHFAGEHVEDKLAFHIAAGNVDIHSLEKVDNFDPYITLGSKDNSIWSSDYNASLKPAFVIGSSSRAASSTAFDSNTVKVKKSRKRKSLKTDDKNMEADTDIGDGDLLNMYANSNNDNSLDLEDEISELEMSFEEHISTKRQKLTVSSQTSQVSTDEEADENNSATSEPPLPTRKKNPFLKSVPASAAGSRPHEVDSRNPVCLIERNKVYQDDSETFIVKSQYFRQVNGSNCQQERRLNSVSVVTRSQRSISKIDETDTLCNITEETKIKEVEDDSQLTIYSLDENNDVDTSEDSAVTDSTSCPNSQETSNSNPECINIDDEDVEYSFMKDVKRSSSQPIQSQRRSPRKRSSALGPCKTLGLPKKGNKKAQIKLDPKQKTISSMFALQQRPKL